MDEDLIVFVASQRKELINMLTSILGARVSSPESVLLDRTCDGQCPGETL